MHFQAYLLDGICRWNAARASDSIAGPSTTLRSFDVKTQDRLNSLSSTVLGQPFDQHYRPPAVFTGELFGIDYLQNETGTATGNQDVDKEIDEGANVEENTDPENRSFLPDQEFYSELDLACNAAMELNIPAELNIVAESEETSIEKDEEALDHRSIDGWNKVDKLAAYLTDSEGLSITNIEAESVIRLYEEMSQFDKSPLTYSRLIQPARGRFGRSKNEGGHVGLEAMKRCFISGGSPALPPSKSRVVEAVCIRLLNKIASPQKDPYVSRFALVVQKYNEIRKRIMLSPLIVKRTRLALYPINETTLSLWYVLH